MSPSSRSRLSSQGPAGLPPLGPLNPARGIHGSRWQRGWGGTGSSCGDICQTSMLLVTGDRRWGQHDVCSSAHHRQSAPNTGVECLLFAGTAVGAEGRRGEEGRSFPDALVEKMNTQQVHDRASVGTAVKKCMKSSLVPWEPRCGLRTGAPCPLCKPAPPGGVCCACIWPRWQSWLRGRQRHVN